MIPYLGDFVEDDVVYMMFNTFSSDDPSASCTITNLINTDVHIHKDDGLTQRNNAAGITVSVNFDGITGSHLIKIDTSDNTVAGFWVTGHDYFVRIEGTTVDAATINAVVGHFSIQNRFMRGTNSANTVVPDAAGVAPTVGEIRTEMEGAGSKLLAIEGYTDKIDDATNGLTAIKAEVEGLAGAAMRGTDGANTTVPDAAGIAPTAAEIKTEVEQAGSSLAQILAQNATAQSDLDKITGADGVTLATLQANYAPNKVVPDAAGVAATPAEVATALTDINLDHLCKNATAAADMTAELADNTIISRMLAHGDTSAFDQATDGLTLIRDRGDAAWITAAGFNTVVPDAAGVAPTASEIKTAIEAAGSHLALILADTGELQTDWKNGGRLDALIDLILGDTSELQGNQANWATATGFSTHNAAAVWSVATRILTASTNFNDLTAAEMKAEVVAALADIKLDHLLNIAVDTDWATTVHLDSVIGHMADVGTAATFNRTTDALEAIRNRGDAAWTTGGGAAPTVGEIRTEMEGAGTKLSNVLTDTNELQTNQGNWITATGFAVPGEYDTPMGYIPSDLGSVPTATELIAAHGSGAWTTADVSALATSSEVAAVPSDVWDEILTGATHNIATSAGRRVREIGAYSIHSGTAQAGDSNSITIAASASPSNPLYNGIFNRNLIVLVDNTGVGQTRTIVDYDAVTKVCVMDRDWRITPDATTTYQITPDDTPLTVDHGVARGGTSRTITIRAYAASDDDAYLCNIVTIIAGAGRGQARLVDSYDGTTKVVTICGDDWVVTPDTTSIYVMMPYGVACAACMGSESLTQIADCVWDDDLTTHTTPNSASWFIQKIKSIANFIRIKLL